MTDPMRQKLAREPFEEKIRKVSQLVRLSKAVDQQCLLLKNERKKRLANPPKKEQKFRSRPERQFLAPMSEKSGI
jgi:hypothetical protein